MWCRFLVHIGSPNSEIIVGACRPSIRAHFLIQNVGRSGATPIVGVAPLCPRYWISKWDHRACHGLQESGMACHTGGAVIQLIQLLRVDCDLHAP